LVLLEHPRRQLLEHPRRQLLESRRAHTRTHNALALPNLLHVWDINEHIHTRIHQNPSKAGRVKPRIHVGGRATVSTRSDPRQHSNLSGSRDKTTNDVILVDTVLRPE